jgi:hypothetical protein
VAQSKSFTVTSRQLLTGGIVVLLLAAAFILGRVTAPKTNVDTAPVTSTSTTNLATTTSTAPSPTTTTQAAGPSLATCTSAVTAVYNGDPLSPQFGAGTLSHEQPIAYGCEDRAMLSEAEQNAVGPLNANDSNLVPNSDVLIVVRDVCNNWPSGPLCVNG